MTSEDNFYGIVNAGRWFNGDELKFCPTTKENNFVVGTTKIYKLKGNKHSYLNEISKCDDQFHKCLVEKVLDSKQYENCSSRCLPMSLPTLMGEFFKTGIFDFKS